MQEKHLTRRQKESVLGRHHMNLTLQEEDITKMHPYMNKALLEDDISLPS